MNDSKPDWIETIDGQHPAFDNLDSHRKAMKEWKDAEAAGAEAMQALGVRQERALMEKRMQTAVEDAGSLGARLHSSETHFLADVQRRIVVARETLGLLLDESVEVEERKEKLVFQRNALATALYQSGQFEDALSVISTASGRAMKGFAKLHHHIKKIIEAVELDDNLDDDEVHLCERETADDVVLDRRFISEEIYSPKHKKVVPVWKCVACGELNASPSIPLRQANRNQLQLQARAAVGNRQGKAAAIPVELSDDRLLRIPS